MAMNGRLSGAIFALSATLMFAAAPSAAQQNDYATRADYPIAGDDGQAVPNHAVRLLGPIERIAGVVTVGNPKGKKTLVEFYDLNCPYCRAASVDVAALLAADPDLRLVLVPYPILGIASIGAARVELAVGKLGTPAQFYAFHRAMFARRGGNDAQRALEVAHGLGLDPAKLIATGNSDEITATMKNLVGLGDTLGLLATPSFIIAGTAVLGYPGRNAVASMLAASAACGKVTC